MIILFETRNITENYVKKSPVSKKLLKPAGQKHRVRLSQEIFAFFFKGKLYIMRGEKMASDNCVIAVNYSTAFL